MLLFLLLNISSRMQQLGGDKRPALAGEHKKREERQPRSAEAPPGQ